MQITCFISIIINALKKGFEILKTYSDDTFSFLYKLKRNKNIDYEKKQNLYQE